MSHDLDVAVVAEGENVSVELTPTEQEQARALAAQIESGSLEAIYSFGRELGTQASSFADGLLEQIKPKELDFIGGRLNEIVVSAQAINLRSLAGKRSKIPLIGSFVDKMRLKGADIVSQFQSVRAQIDQLIAEVEGMQVALAQRVKALDEAFESIKQEHRLLSAHIIAGESVARSIEQRVDLASANACDDALDMQHQQDMRTAVSALQKRITDLQLLQHSALQQLPMIRMVQANNRMLIEKFYTIKELTVPAWKRQFTLALSLSEQKNAVQLANSIDDATNDFLKANAQLLQDNTLSTARANQRLVIDVATLQEVHDTLMNTVQEVARINQDGIRQRDAISSQLQSLRRQLARQVDGG